MVEPIQRSFGPAFPLGGRVGNEGRTSMSDRPPETRARCCSLAEIRDQMTTTRATILPVPAGDRLTETLRQNAGLCS